MQSNELGGFLMTSRIGLPLLAAVALTGFGLTAPAQAQQANMSFFVTSVGKGNGADLGGIAGADAHCQALAKAAGSTNTNWRAYLSTTEPGGAAGVNARDRIGKGPWQKAKGVVVAKSVEDLHSDRGSRKSCEPTWRGIGPVANEVPYLRGHGRHQMPHPVRCPVVWRASDPSEGI
jgi:hypothetical protein